MRGRSTVPRSGGKRNAAGGDAEGAGQSRADRAAERAAGRPPGVTVLLAFLLAVPFAKGWARVTDFQRDVFVVAFLATAVSVALLTAPSSYHRLRFRHGNKEHMVRIGNRLSIAGIAASAVSLEAVVLLVMDYVLSLEAAIVAAASLFAVVASLWYALPLSAAVRDRRAR